MVTKPWWLLGVFTLGKRLETGNHWLMNHGFLGGEPPLPLILNFSICPTEEVHEHIPLRLPHLGSIRPYAQPAVLLSHHQCLCEGDLGHAIGDALGIWDWLHFTKLWSNSWQGCIAWNAWKYVKRPRYHGVNFFSHIRRPTSWPRNLFFCQNWSRSRGFWRLPGHLRSHRPSNGIHTFV